MQKDGVYFGILKTSYFHRQVPNYFCSVYFYSCHFCVSHIPTCMWTAASFSVKQRVNYLQRQLASSYYLHRLTGTSDHILLETDWPDPENNYNLLLSSTRVD